MRAPIITQKRARRLRREMSPPEVLLWARLRGRTTAFTFRRQHAIGPYILDFYCARSRLAIEIDGESHDLPEQAEHDERRDAWLARQDILVVRVMGREVFKSIDEVLTQIWRVAEDRAPRSPPPPASPVPLPLFEGEEKAR